MGDSAIVVKTFALKQNLHFALKLHSGSQYVGPIKVEWSLNISVFEVTWETSKDTDNANSYSLNMNLKFVP